MALSEIVTLLIWAFGILNVVEPLPEEAQQHLKYQKPK